MPDQIRAAIYARISQDRSGAQAGVARQVEESRKVAADRGWRVVEEFRDNDISAKKRHWSATESRFINTTRPGYEAMLDAMRAGQIDAVIAWHPDRLYRRIRDLEDLVDVLERNNVQVVTVRAGRVDLSTASGRLNSRLLGSVAMYESEIKSERVAAAAAQRAVAGRFSGGMRPYGYEPDGVTIRESEAQHFRAAYEGITGGRSLYEVVRRLEAAGATTVTGKRWVAQHLRTALLSPRYAGRATHKGVDVGPAVWPALVDRDTWETTRAILSDPARRTSPGSAPRHLLSGVAICARDDCRQPCRVSKTGGKGVTPRIVYRCPRGHVSRGKELLDAHAVEVTLRLLERDDVLGAVAPTDQVDARPARARDQLTERLDALAVDYAEGHVTREQFHAATATLRARIAEFDAQTASTTRSSALAALEGPDLRTSWATLDLDTQRAIMRELWTIELVPQPSGSRGGHYTDGVRMLPRWEDA